MVMQLCTVRGSTSLLFLLAFSAGPLGACGEGRDPYVVRIDLRQTIRALGSDDLDAASEAESRLLALDEAALPALDAGLRDEPEAVRVGAIETLASMHGDEVARLLVRALQDPAEEVRTDAAMALRLHRGLAVEQALVRALGDSSQAVRQRAALACGASCRTPASVSPLLACALGDEAQAVGWAATTSLGSLRASGDEALAAAVDAAVRTAAPAQLRQDEAERRVRAAILLAMIGDGQGAPVLESLAEERADPRLRLRVLHALGEVGGPGAVAPLRGALTEPGVAVYAHDALRRAAGRGVPGAQAALAGYAGPQSPVPLPPP